MNVKIMSYGFLIMTTLFGGSPAAPAPHTIKLHTNILRMLDGVIDVTSMMRIVAKFKRLQRGESKTGLGSIAYKGKKHYTLKQLVDEEKKNAKDPMLKDALADALKHVHDITGPFREQVNLYRDQLIDVVKDWIKERKRHETVLIKWFEVDESQFTARYLKTFKQLNHFLDEFSLLLVDVKENLPKSRRIFEERLKQLDEQSQTDRKAGSHEEL